MTTSGRDEDPIRPARVTPWITGGLTALGLVAAGLAVRLAPAGAIPMDAAAFMIAFLALSLGVTLIVTPRRFVPGFLIGLMALLVAWRIAALLGTGLASLALVPAFAAYVAQFFEALLADRRRGPAQVTPDADWALAFLRVYAGFDLIPHFTEKLFAGPGPRLADAAAFEGFGLPFPLGFVVLAGLCELGAAIGIGLGLLTRLAGAATALYFLIATLIGGHFENGFIWAAPGGGWEYPVLMMAVFLTFAAVGGGRLSLDAALDENGRFPDALRRFAFPRP